MTASYDLSQLSPDAFERMVNALVLKVLGAGSTGFGPGAPRRSHHQRQDG